MTLTLETALRADENTVVHDLLERCHWDETRSQRVFEKAKLLVENVRGQKKGVGQLETFLRQYSLDTEEGLALMTLAEALIRIPDKATANALIKDKVAAANWLASAGDGGDWMTKAAGFGLSLTRKTLDGVLSRLGEPVIREAIIKAIGLMGRQFVLGETIEDALKRAQSYEKKGYRFSYDILGEGARTAEDAERYFQNYADAIESIGSQGITNQIRPGISVKLSALHPRYEYAQKERCVPALIEKLLHLCTIAEKNNLTLTVDAEEVDRLMISLDIIRGVLSNPSFNKDWVGFGLAIQAYQKRCYPLIDTIADIAKTQRVRLQVRLVKGAYWDTEIKHTQVLGLSGYSVFTRKPNTDVSYLACAARLFDHADSLFPMFATHNAHTISAVFDYAEHSGKPFEFQRLHGMGESLYETVLKNHSAQVCIYAPVGPYKDLLPYLVRRLLENGANSSFVNKLLDPDLPANSIVADPVETVKSFVQVSHPRISLPANLYKNEVPFSRLNSKGLDLNDDSVVQTLVKNIGKYNQSYSAAPLIAGRTHKKSDYKDVQNPSDHSASPGQLWDADEHLVQQAFEIAQNSFSSWTETAAEARALMLERFADLLEEHTDELMALLVREAGKTLPDGIAEIREAVDFARYYANQGRALFHEAGYALPGPTGESNILTHYGRGVFVCISPWNFPLAIFTGQITAALMAGNTVLAKPAEQTGLIAMKAVQLMHRAGIPEDVLHLITGKGSKIGTALVNHPAVAGVCFTGSTSVARRINQTLAQKEGPIVPLIAETGGLNAMIADSSALPEQVIDDVLLSAFGSAGQRCSALRILCVQNDVADHMIDMLRGAIKQLRVGYPSDLSSDVGPVIDDNAREELETHTAKLEMEGKLIGRAPLDPDLREKGSFFAPCAYELKTLKHIDKEVFGPILHVLRFDAESLDSLINTLNGKGYGLTFGLHTRIRSKQDYIAQRMKVGNVYVNRSMIGAVVGVQPFGGQGLSGTGPKAGGPHYLHRFATEKVVSTDTTAAGGNASLVSITE